MSDVGLDRSRSAHPGQAPPLKNAVRLALTGQTEHPQYVKLRSVRPLGFAELDALPAERLLAYRSRLLSLQESAAKSDIDEAEMAALDPTLLYFKDQEQWIDTYAHVKTILAHREHLE